uniref:Histidine-rich glycoprotein n=1 Tax=Rhodnius prolixus TaxID=13249 RepID=A0A4P6D9V6_RHOPR
MNPLFIFLTTLLVVAGTWAEPSFKPVTRVVHYHSEPVAHYVHSRHLHYHEPLHFVHPPHHYHHHHHEDVVLDHHDLHDYHWH